MGKRYAESICGGGSAGFDSDGVRGDMQGGVSYVRLERRGADKSGLRPLKTCLQLRRERSATGGSTSRIRAIESAAGTIVL